MTVREENGRVIVDPEDDPESIIADLEATIDTATTTPRGSRENFDPQARDHVETIHRGAREDDA